MKKVIKSIFIIIMMLVLVFMFEHSSLSVDWAGSVNGLYGANANDNLNTKTRNIMSSIISVVRTIAVGISIIMITVVSMKYMMASAGEKADIKKHAVPFVVGAIVLFAGQGILGIIADFATNNINNNNSNVSTIS